MEQVLQQFCLDGTPVSCEPFGNGHINRTFRVTCSSGRVYTLQRRKKKEKKWACRKKQRAPPASLAHKGSRCGRVPGGII